MQPPASALLISSFDADTILRNLARMAVPHIADCCFVDFLADDRKSVHRVAFAHVDPGAADITWEGESGDEAQGQAALRVIRTGQPVLYADVDEAALAAIGGRPEQAEMLRRFGVRSAMVVPILARGRTLGTITLAATHSGRRYAPPDLAFAGTLGERAGLAVDNARVFKEALEANRMKDEFQIGRAHV